MSEKSDLTGEQFETLSRVLRLIDKGECDPAFELLATFLEEEATE
jgi:hypothetical protein